MWSGDPHLGTFVSRYISFMTVPIITITYYHKYQYYATLNTAEYGSWFMNSQRTLLRTPSQANCGTFFVRISEINDYAISRFDFIIAVYWSSMWSVSQKMVITVLVEWHVISNLSSVNIFSYLTVSWVTLSNICTNIKQSESVHKASVLSLSIRHLKYALTY